MVTQVLDLTPSMTGWYFASASVPRLQPRDTQSPPIADCSGGDPLEAVCLGYGPDGRVRVASARSRFLCFA